MDLRVGEMLMIPLQFEGFTEQEINQIMVYRIEGSNPNQVDTFALQNSVWPTAETSNLRQLTDKNFSRNKDYGYYESYLHDCTLILDWYTGQDTLYNLIVRKSQENVKGCYEDHPNIMVNEASLTHKGVRYQKDEIITIKKP